jgi:hypothetical protein
MWVEEIGERVHESWYACRKGFQRVWGCWLTSRNLAVLCTTEGWPELRASIISVLAVGRCRMRRSSVSEPQLMVMPAPCTAQYQK